MKNIVELTYIDDNGTNWSLGFLTKDSETPNKLVPELMKQLFNSLETRLREDGILE